MERAFPESPRTELGRLPERGSRDVALAYAILDEALYCHVGFVIDGRPAVIPTIHARDGDRLVLHGSAASRMLRTIKGGADVCIVVTLLDGLVLARSAYNHSMNYRSVVIYGIATLIEDEAARTRAMEAVTEHVAPGRWADIRHPDRNENKATMMIEVPLTEASIKTRSGPPGDFPEDVALDIWAGVVPVTTMFGAAEPAPDLPDGIEPPTYLHGYTR